MFDDPNTALKKLQEQLLAAEEPEQDIFAPPPKEPEYEDYDPAEYGEEAPQEPEEEPEAPQEKNRNKVALLVALLLLEVALLFGVLAWWLLW